LGCTGSGLCVFRLHLEIDNRKSTIVNLLLGIPMRTFARTKSFILLAAVGLLLVSSCSNPKNGSLFDPNAATNPQPIISSVSPAGSAYAGMDTIIINGTNFSTTLAENTVLFNTTIAALVKSTTTQITLVAPLVALDSVAIRINVFGADLFSNTFQYKLKAGIATFGGLQSTEAGTALLTDNAGNLYAGYSILGIEAGISKFTPAGVRSSYAPATAGVAFWSGFKMGPGGYIYGVRNVRALYRYSPGGGSSAVLWTQVVGTTFTDIEFDQSGNLWAGGNNANIYRIAQDKTVSSYSFVGAVHSMRVYNGYLYFSAKTDAGEKIWRAQISASGLGNPEIYFDFALAYPANVPAVITFSSDGILYIGTDSPDGLVVVNPDKSYSAPFAAYKSLYTPGFFSLAWGAADDLYATSTSGVLMKFTIRGKKSAPYYGSTL